MLCPCNLNKASRGTYGSNRTSWDPSYCPDNKTCAERCALDGVDENTWRNTYGVTTEGNKLRLNYVT